MSRFGIRRALLFHEIARARASGLGRRLVSQTDSLGFNAIAAPIRSEEGCVGAISLWWPQSYVNADVFSQRHGEALTNAAQAIAHDFDALNKVMRPTSSADRARPAFV